MSRIALIPLVLALAACEKQQAPTPPVAPPSPAAAPAALPGSAPTAAAVTAAPATFTMSVTEKGFEPNRLSVQKGKPVRLIITRKTDKTCATSIVIKDAGIRADLPLDQPVTVTFTPKAAGELRYACGMGMISGVLAVN